MSGSFDVVVLGAGPAGLSAAAELAAEARCLLVEQGPPAGLRDRARPRDLLSGVGGAGLFSDGKHSFFPSATALWTLPDRASLGAAFEATASLLSRFGVRAGPLLPGPAAAAPAGVWQAKDYPAIYVPLVERYRLIEDLYQAAGERLPGARVVDAARGGGVIALEVERDGRRHEVLTRRLVVATGRWSPRPVRPWLESGLGARYAFQRAEFGVRLEASATSVLFARLPGVDGKLRLVEPGESREIRTFCTCRDGEVVLGEADGMRACSGRADGPRTGRSNVGLVVRTRDPSLGEDVARALAEAAPESFDLAEWRERGAVRLARLFGERGAQALTLALERFLSFCPELADEAVRVHAPVIEGVGDYPVDDGSLEVAPGVFVAGDVVGRFRGIVASMVSGRYAARRILAREPPVGAGENPEGVAPWLPGTGTDVKEG